ncbi:unnamed protein product [Amoebophrya sp. A25]|nr:unnamed protein product [Amoebophrya sp. A25]|eukprot:GSA25T00009713001.1
MSFNRHPQKQGQVEERRVCNTPKEVSKVSSSVSCVSDRTTMSKMKGSPCFYLGYLAVLRHFVLVQLLLRPVSAVTFMTPSTGGLDHSHTRSEIDDHSHYAMKYVQRGSAGGSRQPQATTTRAAGASTTTSRGQKVEGDVDDLLGGTTSHGPLADVLPRQVCAQPENEEVVVLDDHVQNVRLIQRTEAPVVLLSLQQDACAANGNEDTTMPMGAGTDVEEKTTEELREAGATSPPSEEKATSPSSPSEKRKGGDPVQQMLSSSDHRSGGAPLNTLSRQVVERFGFALPALEPNLHERTSGRRREPNPKPEQKPESSVMKKLQQPEVVEKEATELRLFLLGRQKSKSPPPPPEQTTSSNQSAQAQQGSGDQQECSSQSNSSLALTYSASESDEQHESEGDFVGYSDEEQDLLDLADVRESACARQSRAVSSLKEEELTSPFRYRFASEEDLRGEREEQAVGKGGSTSSTSRGGGTSKNTGKGRAGVCGSSLFDAKAEDTDMLVGA